MSGERWILVIDEGTTSTRALLYAPDGTVGGTASRPLTQSYPAPGLVEHDAAEIWQATVDCARAMVTKAGGADRIMAIGITNQRETVVAWDRATGRPLAPAIVWQDRRTAARCAELRDAGHEPLVRSRTGLRLDPYFSATKMALLARDHRAARAGTLTLGTVDSWLAFNLTGGDSITDVTNASRTSLFALDGQDWDGELAGLFGVPPAALPRIVPSAGLLGHTAASLFGEPIPIAAMIGDQQSATIGQGCVGPGQTKLTLGTGAFALTALGGSPPADPGDLLGTILVETGGQRSFALEGSIFVAGSLIKWMRDDLGLLTSAAESEAQARSVQDNGGVTVLPALAGLGAPYWLPEARAIIAGLSFSSTAAHIVRAALEAISHQCVDLAAAFARAGAPWSELRIDGGMSANDWLAQDLADMLALPVIRPADVETTARGAAMLAAVGCGLHADLAEARTMLPPAAAFAPRSDPAARDRRLEAWRRTVRMAGA